MKYISRKRNSKEDIVTESGKALNFLYGCFLGRVILKLLITKTVANITAAFMKSRFSKFRIKWIIDRNNINMFEYEDRKFKSFNDFFTRKIKPSARPINARKDVFISPCDSKLLAYKIDENLCLNIKDAYYSIDTLVDKKIMEDYKDGYALVFRLSEENYHRYCYLDSGSKGKNVYIKGVFHTIQYMTLKRYNFFKTNAREYTILNTNNFGKVIQIEIGAMNVGKIRNHHEVYTYKKGEEKGYFEFGGSTIVVLVKKNTIVLDKDIEENSKEGIETLVKYGEGIGKAKLITRLVNKIKSI